MNERFCEGLSERMAGRLFDGKLDESLVGKFGELPSRDECLVFKWGRKVMMQTIGSKYSAQLDGGLCVQAVCVNYLWLNRIHDNI